MPNKNYINGRSREYRLMKILKEEYDFVVRSTGSHSDVDIFAMNTNTKDLILVQSKPKSMSRAAKERLEIQGRNKFDGVYRVKFIVK